jgi:hypothetical protein
MYSNHSIRGMQDSRAKKEFSEHRRAEVATGVTVCQTADLPTTQFDILLLVLFPGQSKLQKGED